uniref:Uncharacterized protein n=1 Tax=Capra hircus TaxID=9925 RepID=A0A8C2R2Q6_CAPHI
LFSCIFFTDIQEFYEVTLLNSQKSCEQKIEEANQVAKKWEKTSLLASCHDNLQKSAEAQWDLVKLLRIYSLDFPLLLFLLYSPVPFRQQATSLQA